MRKAQKQKSSKGEGEGMEQWSCESWDGWTQREDIANKTTEMEVKNESMGVQQEKTK